MIQIKAQVDRFLEYAVITLMGISVLNVLWQVFTRFVLQSPSSWTEELARFLLIWLGLLGAAYAVGKKMHLAIDLMLEKSKALFRRRLEIIIQVLIAVFALLVMVLGGFRLVTITFTLNQISAALQIKLGYIYTVVPLSGLLIIYYNIYFIYQKLQEKD